MKILLSGGGTMGSVSPLIAVYQKIKKSDPDCQFLFIGTSFGPEEKAVKDYKLEFKAIASGRLRRYFDWRNFIDPFKVLWGFFQSLIILIKFKPEAVMIAGAFVGVPVAWASFILRIPVLIHQQDIMAGLANKLMANTAKKITVSFETSLNDFSSQKVVFTGNPIREEIFSCSIDRSRTIFNLKKDLPVLLILGGGTGAQKINDIVKEALKDLLQFCQIIHICGRDKKIDVEMENYHQFEFLSHEMPDALCASDVAVSRAGMSTLSELAVLGKPTVLIPIADSHQEKNAQYFQKNNAVLVLSENSLTAPLFADAVKEVFEDKSVKENLARNIFKMMPQDGAEKVAEELLEL